ARRPPGAGRPRGCGRPRRPGGPPPTAGPRRRPAGPPAATAGAGGSRCARRGTEVSGVPLLGAGLARGPSIVAQVRPARSDLVKCFRLTADGARLSLTTRATRRVSRRTRHAVPLPP